MNKFLFFLPLLLSEVLIETLGGPSAPVKGRNLEQDQAGMAGGQLGASAAAWIHTFATIRDGFHT